MSVVMYTGSFIKSIVYMRGDLINTCKHGSLISINYIIVHILQWSLLVYISKVWICFEQF